MSGKLHDESGSRVEFVLIGDPVAHSLSPVMHNTLYAELGKSKWPFSLWHYDSVLCPDAESAAHRIDLVRTGRYRGMNITMPYKGLALAQADYADLAADVAGGANVLMRDDDLKLCAYNTDGRGAVGAVERAMGASVEGLGVVVCGTGPTSMAIAAAAADARAARVTLMSRDASKAASSANRISASLPSERARAVFGKGYEDAASVVASADVFIDATPRGMSADDAPIVDVSLFHPGQAVLDVVYGHGLTKLVEGARAQGALAQDGLDMLVEQAALSVEIWANNLALPVEVDRSIMRRAALHQRGA